MKKALIILALLAAGLVGFIGNTFKTEDHAGVVTSICYNAATEEFEYNVNVDGGGFQRISSLEYHRIGDDIGFCKNYWGVWEK